MTPSQLFRVVAWMSGTLLSFSVMAVAVRELAGAFSVFEILSIRAGLGLVFTLAAGLLNPSVFRHIAMRKFHFHLLRNGTHLASQYLWALSLTLLPLATIFALEFTMPLWTTLLAALFLGEHLTPSRIGAIACGFIGVLIILQPGLETFRPAAILVLVAAFGYSVSNIATKKLIPFQTTFAIVLWMNAMQLPVAYAFSDPLFFMKIDGSNALAVLGVGVAGLTAHFCLTNALAAGDASVVIPLDFMRLPLIAVVGWLLYLEPLEPAVLIGAGAIIAGVFWNLRSESQSRRTVAPAAAGPE